MKMMWVSVCEKIQKLRKIIQNNKKIKHKKIICLRQKWTNFFHFLNQMPKRRCLKVGLKLAAAADSSKFRFGTDNLYDGDTKNCHFFDHISKNQWFPLKKSSSSPKIRIFLSYTFLKFILSVFKKKIKQMQNY